MGKPRIREVRSGDAPRALGPYNQGIVAGPSRFVFVSGQIGIDPATGELVSSSIGAQTEQSLKNIMAIVREAGGDQASIVKTTVFMARIEDFAAMNAAYEAAIGSPCPARSCVAGCVLPKGAAVEIEAVAVVTGEDGYEGREG
jgi:2-iminobutanoate/2-iminopropanoate deaminase